MFRSKPHADVLRRVFDLPGHGMTPALAEGILALDFPEDDDARTGELNVRANDGQLTDDEQAELEAYINIADTDCRSRDHAGLLLINAPVYSDILFRRATSGNDSENCEEPARRAGRNSAP